MYLSTLFTATMCSSVDRSMKQLMNPTAKARFGRVCTRYCRLPTTH
uniref:Uncharacterized protein n=1 Tax=Arundo donax TaxID=35708 RepID=A0A0A9DP06_ARUDO